VLTRFAAVAAALLLAACTSGSTSRSSGAPLPTSSAATPSGGSPPGASPSDASPTAASGAPATGSGTPAGATVWLCRPGLPGNPCAADRTSTTVSASGAKATEGASAPADPGVDCFYVYPTVSSQPTPNANLHIDPEETAVAVAQASRFAPDCRIYAPMYPQLTRSAIAAGATTTSATAAIKAYLGVLSAWTDYLKNDNHGRGVVLIGHSQGAFLLTALLQREIDPVPSVRKLLVSAVLLGGNVTVPAGKLVGGAFTSIPACTRGTQVGCVVAYSSFDTQPPADSLFGRAGTGIGANFGDRSKAGQQVLCTDPARLDGSGGRLRPYFPTTALPSLGVTTPWVSFPGEYRSGCRTQGGATWLQVTRIRSSDPRPAVHDSAGPTWGLHQVDVNIALGNLVTLVAKQARAYLR
jgi:pimeloyl-ACP methyl ester carboxylesterase